MFRAVSTAAKTIAETRNAKFAYFIEPSLSPDVAGVDLVQRLRKRVYHLGGRRLIRVHVVIGGPEQYFSKQRKVHATYASHCSVEGYGK
jgi:hypothetical protein